MDELPPVLEELFRLLPPAGSAWSTDAQRAWLRAADALFDYFYDEPPANAALPLKGEEQE